MSNAFIPRPHLRRFADRQAWLSALADKLTPFLVEESQTPLGLLWPGGRTPQPLIEELQRRGSRAGPALHLLLTDERMVPAASPHANRRLLLRLARTLGVPRRRLLLVEPAPSRAAAAADYARRLRAFFDRGGRLPLALLGLGSDGHTASLFNRRAAMHDVRLAIPVARSRDWDRVSVTAALLQHAAQVLFIAAGNDKEAVVHKLHNRPFSCPAGLAVRYASRVEIWYTP